MLHDVHQTAVGADWLNQQHTIRFFQDPNQKVNIVSFTADPLQNLHSELIVFGYVEVNFANRLYEHLTVFIPTQSILDILITFWERSAMAPSRFQVMGFVEFEVFLIQRPQFLRRSTLMFFVDLGREYSSSDDEEEGEYER